MHIIRPVRESDLESLEEIAMSATLGIITLPKNREKLKQKIAHSIASFDSNTSSPKNELYLFVLEDMESGRLGGTCAIMSKTGTVNPSFFYRIEKIRENEGDFVPELKVLQPVSYVDGPTEICSLFLKKEFRKEGLGKLLSFSRFLFMACFPEKFDSTTIAEMRGVIEKSLSSPLWDAIGSHFFNKTFNEAMQLRDQGSFDLRLIIPLHAIYISLLPKKARDAIGKVHKNTKPALKMLQQLGFKKTNEIDLLDGGPKIQAKTAEIKVVKNSKKGTIGAITSSEGSVAALVSNTSLNFYVCETKIEVQKKDVITLSKEAALALNVKPGDHVRYYKI